MDVLLNALQKDGVCRYGIINSMYYAAKAWCYATNDSGTHLGCVLGNIFKLKVFFSPPRGGETKYTLKDRNDEFNQYFRQELSYIPCVRLADLWPLTMMTFRSPAQYQGQQRSPWTRSTGKRVQNEPNSGRSWLSFRQSICMQKLSWVKKNLIPLIKLSWTRLYLLLDLLCTAGAVFV